MEEITIATPAFLANAAALLGTAPIRRLRLTAVAPNLDALLASGALDRMLWLDLSRQQLDGTHVARLANAPRLAGLRALSLENNRITDAGVRALWAAPALASLAYCELGNNLCTPLESMELTPEEMSHHEWVPTAFALELEAALGPRRWGFRWADEWPPYLDVVSANP